MKVNGVVPRSYYLGLFLVSLATLLFEIHLTRIFSVTVWYHFSFLAITLSMLGLSIGAMTVYIFPKLFPLERLSAALTFTSVLFAISISLSFIAYIYLRTYFTETFDRYFSLTVILLFCPPFFFSGICICLCLTRFSAQFNRLYAADFLGAGIGCALIVALLQLVDGLSLIFFFSVFAALSALCFASKRWARVNVGLLGVLFLGAGVYHTYLVKHNEGLLWLPKKSETYVRGPVLHQIWNSFSHVQVVGDEDRELPAFGWGLDELIRKQNRVAYLGMFIDGTAFTPLTQFDGDISGHEYLKHDVSNLVYHLRENANTLIVGMGGGRDVLSAVVFGAGRITALEINDAVIQMTTRVFGGYTGHLDDLPEVTVVHNDARTFLEQSHELFDVIQISLVDTWAATAAGAYSLTENSLYTVEAFKSLYSHLSPDGILSISRWYSARYPYEMWRLAALAREALEELSISSPRKHVIIAKPGGDDRFAAGTMLVGRAAFSPDDLSKFEGIKQQMNFASLYTPLNRNNPVFSRIMEGKHANVVTQDVRVDIHPPSDDKPFFFQMLPLQELFTLQFERKSYNRNFAGTILLGKLLIEVILFCLIGIIVPLLIKKKLSIKEHYPIFAFASFVGLGYMLIEIAQLQRFSLLLGNPTYTLSVILFTILTASSIGSFFARKITIDQLTTTIWNYAAFSLSILFATGLMTPYVIDYFLGSHIATRIVVSILLLMPMAFVMGTVLPMGIKLTVKMAPALTSWFWGLNGAFSVLASVLAVIFSMYFGISNTYWVGTACYGLALLTLHRGIRSSVNGRAVPV